MIKAINIEKNYNGEKVLKGVSLHVEAGEFVSIMGESGSGKSTLLSIIGGLLLQDGGSVFWNGQNIADMSENQIAALRCTEMGFVFQSYQLIQTLNVKDNLLLPTILGGKFSKEAEDYMLSLADELEISGLLSKYPAQLSGGQCQRVAILRALVYQPSVIILDEPTGALDSRMEKKVMDLLSRLNREKNTTIVQVTHSTKVAEYGNRMIYIKDGEICK